MWNGPAPARMIEVISPAVRTSSASWPTSPPPFPDMMARARGYDHLVILRCTRKLLRLLGTDPAADPGPAPDAEDWYANLLWFDRRKCLLLTHAGTLFSMFETDLRAADLRDTHRLVTQLIGRELAREGLPATTFGALEEQGLIVARTADRSVLGCMNDMAMLCEHAIATSGGLLQAELADLNRALRRNINSAGGYQRSIDLVRQRLPGQH
jgi:hypothetical protein